MRILYEVNIQTKSDQDWNPYAMYLLLEPYMVPENGADFLEETSYNEKVKFYSEVPVSRMKENLKEALRLYPGMLYVVVKYRYPDEMYHDMFVVFADGRVQEYRTSYEYKEEE